MKALEGQDAVIVALGTRHDLSTNYLQLELIIFEVHLLWTILPQVLLLLCQTV